MTDSNSIDEPPQEPKTHELTLYTPDGRAKVLVVLKDNEDTAHPPSFITLSSSSVEADSRADSASRSAQEQERETHIIISTRSGHQKASYFFENVVSPILQLLNPGERFATHTTKSETSILDLTRDILFREANKGTRLRIILLSGDGGIVDLVNGFSSQTQSESYIAPQIVPLPLGTANALYHSINPGLKDTWGLHALSSLAGKPLPIFTATFSPGAKFLVDEARHEEDLPTNSKGEGVLHGAVVCSWGMHASLVADSDTSEYRKFGVDRFKMAAQEALYPADKSLPHAYKAKVSYLMKDGTWEALPKNEHMYVLSTMVSNLEAPFCISPDSKPLDGSMHLVHFGPTDGDGAMRIMGLAYQGGKHVGDEAVRYEDIEGLRVEFEETDGRWRRVCVDGMIVRVAEGGSIEIKKGTGAESVLHIVVGEEEGAAKTFSWRP